MDYFEIIRKIVQLDFSTDFGYIREQSGYSDLSDYRIDLYIELVDMLIKKINLPFITDLWFDYEDANSVLYRNCNKIHDILKSYFVEDEVFEKYSFTMGGVDYILEDDTVYENSIVEYNFVIKNDLFSNTSSELWLMNLTVDKVKLNQYKRKYKLNKLLKI